MRSLAMCARSWAGGPWLWVSHSPRCFNIFLIIRSSSINAMILMGPRHFGRISGSTSWIFWIRRAQFCLNVRDNIALGTMVGILSHKLLGETDADDISGQVLKPLFIIGPNPRTKIDMKTAMMPGEHVFDNPTWRYSIGKRLQQRSHFVRYPLKRSF